MVELARGNVGDRPWGRTLAALGLRGVTGQLALATDAKRFVVGFEQGAVVTATSPLTSDAAVRVALTGHLLSSSQVPEISRRQALAPDRDEIDVIAELARLGPDHALRLRRRVIAQRAARTFSISHGQFVVTDWSELPVLDGCALDIRAVIYMGARANLSEHRLAQELDQLGSWFRLKPAMDDDLPQFGFGDAEQPIIERLRDGGTIEDIEEWAASFIDSRTVRAVVYSLASYNACDHGPPRPRRPHEDALAMTREVPRVAGQISGTAATQPISELTPISIARLTPISDETPTSIARIRPVTRSGTEPGVARSRPITEGTPISMPRAARPTPVPSAARSSGSIRIPQDSSASGSIRIPQDGGASGSIRIPPESRSGNIRIPTLPPATPAPRGTDAGVPRAPRARSSTGVRSAGVEAGDLALPPSEVIRRVPAARPAPKRRELAGSDSPQSHDVKATIAQRLKLLDQGADHYQLLGVGQDASSDAIRKAYFALARQLHPDRLAALGISDDGRHAQRLFAQINAGFAVLSDPARREHYLSVLRRGGEAAIRAEDARAEQLARRVLEAEEAFRRGELALRRDQPAAAVAELTLAVQLDPDEADYQAMLAWSQFCAAPDKAAVAHATRAQLDEAIERSPQAVTGRFYLGRVERMLGRDQDAARHFREVLAAAPGHTEAAAELRVIESRLGDKPGGGGLFGRKR
ncbi:MAG TPA: DnaJ domain-containing protein [Kofleriaceae bacterium]